MILLGTKHLTRGRTWGGRSVKINRIPSTLWSNKWNEIIEVRKCLQDIVSLRLLFRGRYPFAKNENGAAIGQPGSDTFRWITAALIPHPISRSRRTKTFKIFPFLLAVNYISSNIIKEREREIKLVREYTQSELSPFGRKYIVTYSEIRCDSRDQTSACTVY